MQERFKRVERIAIQKLEKSDLSPQEKIEAIDRKINRKALHILEWSKEWYDRIDDISKCAIDIQVLVELKTDLIIKN